jgi:hypothetical protein
VVLAGFARNAAKGTRYEPLCSIIHFAGIIPWAYAGARHAIIAARLKSHDWDEFEEGGLQPLQMMAGLGALLAYAGGQFWQGYVAPEFGPDPTVRSLAGEAQHWMMTAWLGLGGLRAASRAVNRYLYPEHDSEQHVH